MWLSKVFAIFVLCISIFFIACNSSDDSATASTRSTLNDTIQLANDYYYTDVVFPGELMGVYGDWIPLNACGGDLVANCEDINDDYDYLRIEENGIFKLFKNNQIVMYGKIIFFYKETGDENTGSLPYVIFSPDSSLGCDDLETVYGEEVCMQIGDLHTPYVYTEIRLSENGSFLVFYYPAISWSVAYEKIE